MKPMAGQAWRNMDGFIVIINEADVNDLKKWNIRVLNNPVFRWDNLPKGARIVEVEK